MDSEDDSGAIIPGDRGNEIIENRGGLRHYNHIGGNRYTFEARSTRSDFKEFFNSSQGEIPWQLHHVRNCGHVHNQ